MGGIQGRGFLFMGGGSHNEAQRAALKRGSHILE